VCDPIKLAQNSQLDSKWRQHVAFSSLQFVPFSSIIQLRETTFCFTNPNVLVAFVIFLDFFVYIFIDIKTTVLCDAEVHTTRVVPTTK